MAGDKSFVKRIVPIQALKWNYDKIIHKIVKLPAFAFELFIPYEANIV